MLGTTLGQQFICTGKPEKHCINNIQYYVVDCWISRFQEGVWMAVLSIYNWQKNFP